MKNKLMLRLCLMMIALLFSHSCRQDILSEQEAYNNTSAFQLTSKRISLDESKHKAQLLPELKKAEVGIEALSKTEVSGKIINYGNGVSIDTDEVIYIEKGPDFHSYTFHINHENAPANAPVENLVLTIQEDGTYSELLLSYNFTPQEKQMLENNIPVDTKGKVAITELAQGTYNSGEIMGKSNMSCEWIEETVSQPCSQNEHDISNADECYFTTHPEAGTPPKSFIAVIHRCTALPVDYGLGENGEGGGSGPQNGPGGLANENPEQTVTAPNVPLPPKNSPCAILKRNSNDTEFQNKLDSLKTRVLPTTPNYDEHETAIVVTNDFGQLTYNTFVMPREVGANVQSVKIGITNSDIAVMHNHSVKSAFLSPSYLDLVDFYDHYKFLDAGVKKYYIYYLTCYNGEVYALKADNIADLDAFFAGFTTIGSGNFSKNEQKKAYDRMKRRYEKYGMKDKKPHDKDKSEKIFLKVAQSFGNGISLYRRNNTGWGKLRLDPDGTVKSDDCPL